MAASAHSKTEPLNDPFSIDLFLGSSPIPRSKGRSMDRLSSDRLIKALRQRLDDKSYSLRPQHVCQNENLGKEHIGVPNSLEIESCCCSGYGGKWVHFEEGRYDVDFCLVKKNNSYHLFYTRGKNISGRPNQLSEAILGHAISKDLFLWKDLGQVVPVGSEGDWDAKTFGAPHIVENGGVYYMLYTGWDKDEVQRIGLATSRDLFHWTKNPDSPFVEPPGWSNSRDCRDRSIVETLWCFMTRGRIGT